MALLAQSAQWAGMACGWWRRWRPCRAAWPLLLSLSMLAPLLISLQARATPPGLVIDSDPVAMPCAAAGVSVLHAAPLFFASTPMTAVGAVAGGDMIQASYRTDDWSGHLERRAWLLDGAGQPVPASPVWDAGALLTGDAGGPPVPAPALRNIHTAIVQPDGSLVMVPFEWERLSGAQRSLLDQTPPVPGAMATAAASASATAVRHIDGLGALRLAWLRGVREQEGLLFRRRTGVLGDTVNANPVYVGAPSGTAAGDGYAAFYASHKARRPVVYLGANDGMLHGFDAADGTELFAYVPDALMASLNQLPSLSYVHRAYVDGPAVAADALLGAGWKTVLVAAMGAGAQGVLALDVTDPGLLASNGALWEFTDRDDPMMGNVLLPPQIARLRTIASGGSASAGRGAGTEPGSDASATFRYFAVVASGIDNVADDGHRSSAGNGALFLLALDKPRAQPWKLNLNYYRLVTPAGDATLANALGAPALVNDADGVLMYGYAGDLQGNLWRFDVSGNAPWSGAVGPGPGKQPLFTARDAAGTRQPIAQQPKVVYAPDGGYLLLFGTGRMITRADRSAASYAPQSYYAIRDTLATPPQLVTSRRQLTPRFLDGGTGSGSGSGIGFSLSGAAIEAGSMGWYIDFADAGATGERSLNAGTLVDGALLFNTLLPAARACDAVTSRTYALDVLSGLPDSRVVPLAGGLGDSAALVGLSRAGYAPAPVALALSRSVAGTDGAGRALLRRSFAIVSPGAGDVLGAPLASVAVALPLGRLSWREVANWRELHQALKK